MLNACFRAVNDALPYTTDAIVVLPDHIHCIWTLPDHDLDFSTRWKKIKSAFTRRYSGPRAATISQSMCRKKEASVWQRRFWEHRIRDESDFNRHCDYIHYNPVKHGYVSLPSQWKHGSFGQFVELGFYAPDWGHAQPEQPKGLHFE